MEGQAVYKTDAEAEEIRNMNRFKYRRILRENITEFADELKKKY